MLLTFGGLLSVVDGLLPPVRHSVPAKKHCKRKQSTVYNTKTCLQTSACNTAVDGRNPTEGKHCDVDTELNNQNGHW